MIHRAAGQPRREHEPLCGFDPCMPVFTGSVWRGRLRDAHGKEPRTQLRVSCKRRPAYSASESVAVRVRIQVSVYESG